MRLIDAEGKQAGVVTWKDAMVLAREAGVDLVEVSPGAVPPVCKIMDFGKYRYELLRKAKAARKKQHVSHLKEVKMRPKIGSHDYAFKKKNVIRFLERGDKVKMTVMFHGREMAYLDQGRQLLYKLQQELEEYCKPEKAPVMEGRNMLMFLIPK